MNYTVDTTVYHLSSMIALSGFFPSFQIQSTVKLVKLFACNFPFVYTLDCVVFAALTRTLVCDRIIKTNDVHCHNLPPPVSFVYNKIS